MSLAGSSIFYDTARRASSLQVQQDTEARPGISTLKRGNLKKLITAKASPASSEIIIEEEDNTDKDTMETKDNLDKVKSEDSNETEPEEEPVRRRRPNMVISFDNFDGSSLPPPPPAPSSSIRLSSLPAIPDEFTSIFSQERQQETIQEEGELSPDLDGLKMTNPFDEDEEELPDTMELEVSSLPPPPPPPTM